MSENGRTLGIYMDEETLEELDRQASRMHQTKAGLIRAYIWEKCFKEQRGE